MSQMLKSSGAMAAATLTSSVLGMVREMVYANFMGTTWVASAFLLAFQIPNLFRRLLGEGALTAAFIPIFKEKEKLEGDAAMWRASNAVISGLIVLTCIVVALGFLVVTAALAFGHDRFEAKTLLMLSLLRVMLPEVAPSATSVPMSRTFSITIRIRTVMMLRAATITMSPTAMLIRSFSRLRAVKNVRFMAIKSLTK